MDVITYPCQQKEPQMSGLVFGNPTNKCNKNGTLMDKYVRFQERSLIEPGVPGGRFKNAYELLNLRAFKISMFCKNDIFQCMGK